VIRATAAVVMVWMLAPAGASPVTIPAAAVSPVAGAAPGAPPNGSAPLVGSWRSESGAQSAVDAVDPDAPRPQSGPRGAVDTVDAVAPRSESAARDAVETVEAGAPRPQSGARGAVEMVEAGATRWQWPVTPPRIVQAYAAPPSPYAAGHRGIDLAAVTGTVVVAPSDATVHFAGVVVDRPVLTLDHGAGVLSSYEPLLAEGLKAGDAVTRGSPLGIVGTGAHCSNSCLHVGVRIDGDYVSPLLFFDRVPRSVLLPLHAGGSIARQARG
jgi:murein DD-endopeptidase MepM/ murein hydrolase activator NlpD